MVLKLAVSLALLAYLLWRGDVGELRALLATADRSWMALALALYLGSHLVNALRWQWYASALGVAARGVDFARLYFVGLFVNLFTPGTIAGDVTRGLGLAGKRGRGVALLSVLAHRLTGLVALLTLASVAALLQWQYPLSWPLRAAIATVPGAALAALLLAPRAAGLLSPALGRPLDFPRQWVPATLRTLPAAVCYHAMQIGAMLLVSRALSIKVAAATLSLFVPLANIAGMLPITVSGLGIREATYVFFLRAVGGDADSALALGLLGSGMVLAAGLSGTPALLMPGAARSRSTPD
jgi:uncharacterized membrane protein YbhN (UPF0104 family)